ncbi:predicted protein [Histoplasma capsulatum var. duboisii H88]|uniref:Predicted protein n=1 Tax=Ajellomyces capsulatus (strain H88) TaxID=544711 RepID=F0UUV3_AJEC8|nr:predicted protein [Histoplasma capsulatum var. duboisii H88]
MAEFLGDASGSYELNCRAQSQVAGRETKSPATHGGKRRGDRNKPRLEALGWRWRCGSEHRDTRGSVSRGVTTGGKEDEKYRRGKQKGVKRSTIWASRSTDNMRRGRCRVLINRQAEENKARR